MRRIDLPELGDQPWCPRWLRDAMTGYLQVVIAHFRPYDIAIPTLSDVLGRSSSTQVVDLASGAGGPWPQLYSALKETHPSLRVTLTDLEPNLLVLEQLRDREGIDYLAESVSAADVPADLGSVRTMFTALHHFDREQLRSILTSAQRDRVGFVACEATHRSLRGVATTLFIPILVLALMPRVRPRRIVPLLLTYFPPVLPLLIWWDGLASTLRTYSAPELRALVGELAEPGYSWRVDELRVRGAPIPVLQLLGRPVPQSSAR